MGNLVLSRKPGESIDIYAPDDECFGPIVITQGKISGGKSSIAIDATRNLMIKRSEISDKQPSIENKHYSLGADPIAAIASTTKKLPDILAENPKLRVWGIRRRDAHCEQIWNVSRHYDLQLTWCVDAWSVRPTTGIYQQIIIFVPRVDK